MKATCTASTMLCKHAQHTEMDCLAAKNAYTHIQSCSNANDIICRSKQRQGGQRCQQLACLSVMIEQSYRAFLDSMGSRVHNFNSRNNPELCSMPNSLSKPGLSRASTKSVKISSAIRMSSSRPVAITQSTARSRTCALRVVGPPVGGFLHGAVCVLEGNLVRFLRSSWITLLTPLT